MNLRKYLFGALLLAVMATAGTSHAQDADAPGAPSAAEEHYNKGREFRTFGAYDAAIKEFLAAYELSEAPELLFNIAQTYREKGDKQMALDYYKKYIQIDSEGTGALIAKSHIEALEKAIADELTAAEAVRKEAEATAEREAELAASTKVAASEAKSKRSLSKVLRWGGLGTTVAGIATLGTSIYFGNKARTLSREASDVTGMWTSELQQKTIDAESAEDTAFILAAAGGAALLTGGLLYFVGRRMGNQGPREKQSEQLTVTPSPLPGGGASLVLVGSF